MMNTSIGGFGLGLLSRLNRLGLIPTLTVAGGGGGGDNGSYYGARHYGRRYFGGRYFG